MLQEELNVFCKNVRFKFKNILQNLTIIIQEDEINKTKHLYLVLIRIRKTKRNNGYGSLVLKEITNFADKHNIEIYLNATTLLGSSRKRLYCFYEKHNFALIKNTENTFKYKPQKHNI